MQTDPDLLNSMNGDEIGSPQTTFSRDAEALPPAQTETATFGLGCFWGPDARFGAMDGVVRTRVGYAGGTKPDPTYYSLGDHTEVVQIEYDPNTLAYEDLLDVFWANHDPRSATGKRQYRSVALTATESQGEAAHRTRDTVAERLDGSVCTDIERLDRFSLAEEFHQKYELRSTPTLGDELVQCCGGRLVDSTVAARLNGVVAGYGSDDQQAALLAELELPPAVLAEVRRRI